MNHKWININEYGCYKTEMLHSFDAEKNQTVEYIPVTATLILF